MHTLSFKITEKTVTLLVQIFKVKLWKINPDFVSILQKNIVNPKTLKTDLP